LTEFVYLSNVVTLKLDDGKCTGCGMCLEVCPHNVLEMNRTHVRIQSRDACMECGACSRNCPFDAISVQSGVGCAAAVINSMLGKKGRNCCSIDDCNGSSSDKKATCCS
jgi:ferredoxin